MPWYEIHQHVDVTVRVEISLQSRAKYLQPMNMMPLTEIPYLLFVYLNILVHRYLLTARILNCSTEIVKQFRGRNGAGKTTTIKLLLGLLTPAAGTCRVLGLDATVDALAVRRSVGYMDEDQQMYWWMRVEQIVKWVAAFSLLKPRNINPLRTSLAVN